MFFLAWRIFSFMVKYSRLPRLLFFLLQSLWFTDKFDAPKKLCITSLCTLKVFGLPFKLRVQQGYPYLSNGCFMIFILDLLTLPIKCISLDRDRTAPLFDTSYFPSNPTTAFHLMGLIYLKNQTTQIKRVIYVR